MKKLIVTLSVLLALTGCESSIERTRMHETVKGADSIQVLCLEGVQYYFYHKGNKAGITPAIDKDTLTYKTCEK